MANEKWVTEAQARQLAREYGASPDEIEREIARDYRGATWYWSQAQRALVSVYDGMTTVQDLSDAMARGPLDERQEAMAADFWAMAAQQAHTTAAAAWDAVWDETEDTPQAFDALTAAGISREVLTDLQTRAEELNYVANLVDDQRIAETIAYSQAVRAVYDELIDRPYYEGLDNNTGRQDEYSDQIWGQASDLVDNGKTVEEVRATAAAKQAEDDAREDAYYNEIREEIAAAEQAQREADGPTGRAWRTAAAITYREHVIEDYGNDGPPEDDRHLSPSEVAARAMAVATIAGATGVPEGYVFAELQAAAVAEGSAPGSDNDPDYLAPPNWETFTDQYNQYETDSVALAFEGGPDEDRADNVGTGAQPDTGQAAPSIETAEYWLARGEVDPGAGLSEEMPPEWTPETGPQWPVEPRWTSEAGQARLEAKWAADDAAYAVEQVRLAAVPAGEREDHAVGSAAAGFVDDPAADARDAEPATQLDPDQEVETVYSLLFDSDRYALLRAGDGDVADSYVGSTWAAAEGYVASGRSTADLRAQVQAEIWGPADMTDADFRLEASGVDAATGMTTAQLRGEPVSASIAEAVGHLSDQDYGAEVARVADYLTGRPYYVENTLHGAGDGVYEHAQSLVALGYTATNLAELDAEAEASAADADHLAGAREDLTGRMDAGLVADPDGDADQAEAAVAASRDAVEASRADWYARAAQLGVTTASPTPLAESDTWAASNPAAEWAANEDVVAQFESDAARDAEAGDGAAALDAHQQRLAEAAADQHTGRADPQVWGAVADAHLAATNRAQWYPQEYSAADDPYDHEFHHGEGTDLPPVPAEYTEHPDAYRSGPAATSGDVPVLPGSWDGPNSGITTGMSPADVHAAIEEQLGQARARLQAGHTSPEWVREQAEYVEHLEEWAYVAGEFAADQSACDKLGEGVTDASLAVEDTAAAARVSALFGRTGERMAAEWAAQVPGRDPALWGREPSSTPDFTGESYPVDPRLLATAEAIAEALRGGDLDGAQRLQAALYDDGPPADTASVPGDTATVDTATVDTATVDTATVDTATVEDTASRRDGWEGWEDHWDQERDAGESPGKSPVAEAVAAAHAAVEADSQRAAEELGEQQQPSRAGDRALTDAVEQTPAMEWGA